MAFIRPAVIMAASIFLHSRLLHAATRRSAAAFVSSTMRSSSSSILKPSYGLSSPSSRTSSLMSTSTTQSVDTVATSPPLAEFKVNLLTTPLPELETIIKSWGFPGFRARQINNWIFKQGVREVDEMTDLPLKLRSILNERTTIGSLHLEIEQVSNDGTIKRAYKLHDNQVIESVLMPYEDGRRTACISSQAGCAMGECNTQKTHFCIKRLPIKHQLAYD